MTRNQVLFDVIVGTFAILAGVAIIVIGGVFHQNTLAGAIARFFWSL